MPRRYPILDEVNRDFDLGRPSTVHLEIDASDAMFDFDLMLTIVPE